MKKFIMDMVSDSQTKTISSKRVIGILGFLFLAINMTIACYVPIAKPIPAELISAIEFITIAAVFGTTADRFAKVMDSKKQ